MLYREDSSLGQRLINQQELWAPNVGFRRQEEEPPLPTPQELQASKEELLYTLNSVSEGIRQLEVMDFTDAIPAEVEERTKEALRKDLSDQYNIRWVVWQAFLDTCTKLRIPFYEIEELMPARYPNFQSWPDWLRPAGYKGTFKAEDVTPSWLE